METKKGFVTLTKRPRPDHPTEKQPVMIREDMIGEVSVDDFNYKPDDAAPVALLPNAKVLKGEATFVFTVTGRMFVVSETPDVVIERIMQARAGHTLPCNYTPTEPVKLKVVGDAKA